MAEVVNKQTCAAAEAARSPALRAGQGEPLILLHGVTGSAAMWRRVVPLLAAQHDAIALTALGHRGGAAPTSRPVRIQHVVDDVERQLDSLGLQSVHLAGNSLGGWVALELARRGRAKSVCALSPAGAWSSDERAGSASKLRRVALHARMTRALLPVLGYSAAIRSLALREIAVHGERATRDELIELSDDLLGCYVHEDLFETPERLEPLTAACPIVLAWSQKDRIFPVERNGRRARELVPGARFEVLEDVGHVPMIDDPALVARTILASVASAQDALHATVS